jgi:hypothetical protein
LSPPPASKEWPLLPANFAFEVWLRTAGCVPAIPFQQEITMTANCIARTRLRPAHIAALVVLACTRAGSAQAAHVEAGVLNCVVYGGTGFVFGSSKQLDCTFKGINGGTEHYRGAIDKYGLDLGFTSESKIIWTVFAPSIGIPRGALAGTYGGASAEATVGFGVGANALVGGSGSSIALQPVSVQGQKGLNIAVGISQLRLRPE